MSKNTEQQTKDIEDNLSEPKNASDAEPTSSPKRKRSKSKSARKGRSTQSKSDLQNFIQLLQSNSMIPDAPLTEEEETVLPCLKKFLFPIILRSRDGKDQKRRNIIRELIQTERNYVNELTILMDIYYKPLDMSITTRKPLIDSTSLLELFGNCDEIRDTHQEGILDVMEKEILPHLQEKNPDKSIYIRLTTCFLELIPHLQQLYTSYLSTKEHSDELLLRLKKNKQFREFLSKQLFNPASKCQEIEDLIILPTQRMGGYKLLLERLLKYCYVGGFEEIRVMLDEVINAIVTLGKAMNQNTTDSSNQEKLLNIAESVSHLPPFLVLMRPGKKCLGDFKCHMYDKDTGKICQTIIGYILSDMILLTTVTKGRFGSSKQLYLDAIPYPQIKIQPSELIEHADRQFCLKTDTQSYYLRMAKAKDKKEFEKIIKATKKKIRSNVKQQVDEGQAYMESLFDQLASMYTEPQPARTREEALTALSV